MLTKKSRDLQCESALKINGSRPGYYIDAVQTHYTKAFLVTVIFCFVSLNAASRRATRWTWHWCLLLGAGKQSSRHLHPQPRTRIRGQDGEQPEVCGTPDRMGADMLMRMQEPTQALCTAVLLGKTLCLDSSPRTGLGCPLTAFPMLKS